MPDTPLSETKCECPARKALARRGIYVASKVKHAPMWKRLQSYGESITATWIHEAGEGQTADHVELADRCLREIAASEAVILYCEPGDVLKGALIEAGAALALGIPVYCVGACESLSARTFSKHPLWHESSTVNEATEAIIRAKPQRQEAALSAPCPCEGLRDEHGRLTERAQEAMAYGRKNFDAALGFQDRALRAEAERNQLRAELAEAHKPGAYGHAWDKGLPTLPRS